MHWDDLRYFLAAYRSRSLAGAARELGCEYTTVGRRITQLEAALSTTLFTRTPEGLTPTAAALELLPHAERIEQSARAIASHGVGHDQRIEGVVRITCPEGFSAYVVEQLGALHARHPGLTAQILADVRPLDLMRDEADLALRMSPTTQPDLVTRTLGTMSWRMFAARAYTDRHGAPSPVHDLRGHDVVGYDDSLAHVPGARWLAEHGEGAHVVVRANSLAAVLEACASGLGLAVLPHFFGARDARLHAVAREVLGTRTLCMVVHPDKRRLARIRAAMDFLAATIELDLQRGVFG